MKHGVTRGEPVGHNLGPKVECYSGFSYAQEPLAFEWQGQRCEINKVERRWREPQGPRFRVCTADGLRWQLKYDEGQDSWSVEKLT